MKELKNYHLGISENPNFILLFRVGLFAFVYLFLYQANACLKFLRRRQ